MSRFSGKCDFADYIEIHGIDKVMQSDVFIGNNLVPLRIETKKDLVPYYPMLVSVCASENGVGMIRLTEESYIDTLDNQYKRFFLENAIKDYKRYKKKGKPFDVHGVYLRSKAENEIRKRVLASNGKTKFKDIEDLHTQTSEIYRKNLFDEMVRAGWREQEAYLYVYHDISGAIRYGNGTKIKRDK